MYSLVYYIYATSLKIIDISDQLAQNKTQICSIKFAYSVKILHKIFVRTYVNTLSVCTLCKLDS